MRSLWLALVLLSGCITKNASYMTGGITTGAITAPIHGDPQIVAAMTTPDTGGYNGVELRGYVATDLTQVAIPNAGGFAVRQLGDGVQSSMQTGWMIAPRVGGGTLFGRLMFDVISSTKQGEDTTLSAFSPTVDVGVAPWGKGLCFSASATWDVQFNAPDRGIVGMFAGLCGGAMKL